MLMNLNRDMSLQITSVKLLTHFIDANEWMCISDRTVKFYNHPLPIFTDKFNSWKPGDTYMRQ